MGYDSTILVADVSQPMTFRGKTVPPQHDSEGRTYATLIATFDLAKMGGGSKFTQLLYASAALEPNVFVYGPFNGDDQVDHDRYDQPLIQLDLDDTIAALDADNDGYRRIPPALAMLKAFAEVRDQYMGLAVFHYGH